MLGELVAEIAPFRWKLFQVKRIEGQNGESFDELAVTVAEFGEFVERNQQEQAARERRSARTRPPTNISSTATAQDQMSVRRVRGPPWACSGEQQAGVTWSNLSGIAQREQRQPFAEGSERSRLF